MAAYVLEGPRWGNGAAGSGATVSWAVDSSIPTSFLAEIRAAFATWSSYANLIFQQVSSTATANIDFSNGYIDGLNKVLGQATYYYSGQRFTSAQVTFDSGEGWRVAGSDVRSSTGVDLYVVALHEIGHAVGLDHYNDTPALMNAYLSSSVTGLTASDISGIQALYGAPAATSVAPVSLPKPVAAADSYAAIAGRTLSQTGSGVLANDSVANGAGLSVSAVNNLSGNVGQMVSGSYGSLTLNANGSFTYMSGALVGAPTGTHLVDHFTYAVSANGLATTGNLDVVLDRLPVVSRATASIVKAPGASLSVDAARGVLAGAIDPDGDALLVSAVGPGAASPGQVVAGQYGSLTMRADGGFTYKLTGSGPAAGPQSHEIFAFQVSDGRGGTVSAHLDLTILGAASANAAQFGSFVYDATSTGGKVYAVYDAFLGRAADPLGLAAWTKALDQGLAIKDLAQGFLTSPEGQARAGALGNSAFVEQLYSATLHRPSDPAGLQGWTDALTQGSTRADVALGFALSAEHLSNLKATFDAGVFVPDASAAEAARLYYGILGRAPDADGLAAATSALKHGTTLTSLAQQFVAAPEAQAKFAGVDDGRFVGGLYENALGRPVDSAGQHYWVEALQHGTSRAEVAVLVSESHEAQLHLVDRIETGWDLI